MPTSISTEEYLEKKQAKIFELDGLMKEVFYLKEQFNSIKENVAIENMEDNIKSA